MSLGTDATMASPRAANSGCELRGGEDIQIVVANALEHTPSGIQRIHRRRHPMRLAHGLLHFGHHRRIHLESRINPGGGRRGARRSIARGAADIGIDDARAEHRHADIGVGQFGAECLHHADHGKLGCGIDPRRRMAQKSRQRGHRHDLAALALRLDARQKACACH